MAQFKTIQTARKYEISNSGIVRNAETGSECKQNKGRVTLYIKKGTRKSYKVADLMAIYWPEFDDEEISRIADHMNDLIHNQGHTFGCAEAMAWDGAECTCGQAERLRIANEQAGIGQRADQIETPMMTVAVFWHENAEGLPVYHDGTQWWVVQADGRINELDMTRFERMERNEALTEKVMHDKRKNCERTMDYNGQMLVLWKLSDGTHAWALGTKCFTSLDLAMAYVNQDEAKKAEPTTVRKATPKDERGDKAIPAPAKPKAPRKGLKLNCTQVLAIRAQLAEGQTMRAVAEYMKIHPSLVADVKYGTVKAYAEMK